MFEIEMLYLNRNGILFSLVFQYFTKLFSLLFNILEYYFLLCFVMLFTFQQKSFTWNKVMRL